MRVTKTVLVLNHYERLGPRVSLEVAALREAGYMVRVIHWATTPATNDAQTVAGIEEEHILYSRPRGTINVLKALPGYYRRLWRHVSAGGFDIIHCTHIMLLPLALRLARRHAARAVYDVYEFHLQDTAEGLPWWFRWVVPVLRTVERYHVRRVDGVLTVDSAGGWLKRYYGRLNANTRVLYNVPDVSRPLPEPSLDLRSQYAGRRVVIYVGGLSEKKGALRAVEAAERVVRDVPEALCLFIGVFHGNTERRFWDRVAEGGLRDHVEHIPWLSYDRMLEYLAIADVGLALHQPSKRYRMVGKGNGRKMFTYMQVGLPIVGPDFGALGELIREESVGITVDTQDPAQIAAAIVRILRDPDQASEYGDNGRGAIESRYNWALERSKLLQLYAGLEGNRRCRRSS